MKHPTLHDLARYYADQGLVGEERAGLTSTLALAGGASVIWRGASGTGKTIGADITVGLLPEDIIAIVDMLSAMGIWSKGVVDRIIAALVVYLPEEQNAGDNDEVTKALKKWGDMRPAKREKSIDYGQDTEVTELPPRLFLTTAALTNEAHKKSFDPEKARRVVKVNTDPSAAATRRVKEAKARAMIFGKENVRLMTPIERRKVKAHVARVMTTRALSVKEVRFFGAMEIQAAIPDTFPEARSALALWEKLLMGVARWYAHDEIVIDGTAFLSPQRVAEAWAFYGDILVENALKLEAGDRAIIDSFPPLVLQGTVAVPTSCLDMSELMDKLVSRGLTDPTLVRRQVKKLVENGLLAEAAGGGSMGPTRWHKTHHANVASRVDWPALFDSCEEHARSQLEGKDRADYLRRVSDARKVGMVNPITGQAGPIYGPESVLNYDPEAGYVPTKKGKDKAPTKGLFKFN